MKFLARLIALILLVSCFAMFGCGSNGGTTGGSTGGSTGNGGSSGGGSGSSGGSSGSEGGSESVPEVSIAQTLTSAQASYMATVLDGAPSSAFSTDGTTLQLVNGNYRLEFVKSTQGYKTQIVNGTTNAVTYVNENPAMINVRKGTSLAEFTEETKKAVYSTVTKTDYGYEASAVVSSTNGSKYEFTDKYYIIDSAFNVDRYVKVTESKSGDSGFGSEYAIFSNDSNKTAGYFDYFVPCLKYKDSNMMRFESNAFYSTDKAYERDYETKIGLPLVMARNTSSGNVLTLQHLKPNVSSPYNDYKTGAVNALFKYGAMGYYYGNQVGLTYAYPMKSESLALFHPNTKGFTQAYTLSLIPDKQNSYNAAMMNSYKTAYMNENPKVEKMDVDLVYEQNMELFNAYYREFGTGSVKCAGVPFAIELKNGSSNFGWALAGGFVGQQVPIGYQLLQYGYDNENETAIARGKTIMNFWTSDTIMKAHTVPIIWWDAADNAAGGTERTSMNNYLRYLTDIPEGMLDAYLVAKRNGEEMTQWYNAVVQYADWFVARQRSDGSWYRCYDRNNNGIANASGTSDTYGMDTNNTHVPVRFLAKMYELTGQNKYKNAAVRAADFCYTRSYLDECKYVGGTADNPNIIDKEAAAFAMYAFNAAYTLTGEQKYLEAAEHAAINTCSWNVCYDYPVLSQNEYIAEKYGNPFTNGNTKGFSVIGTGVTAADNWNNYVYYELYKMSVYLGGDEFYKNTALLLQNASKRASDFDGRLGYNYSALMPEATNIHTFKYTSTNTWLPWSGVANIEPMINMQKTLGTRDILEIDISLADQLALFKAYGVGGKI